MSWLSRNLAKLGLGDWFSENFPTADSASNDHTADVVGNKADTATTTVNATTSIVRYIKGLLGLHPVPTADVATNTSMRDVIGNKDDTTAGTSIVAIAKNIVANVGVVDTNVDTLIANRPKLVERDATTLPQTTQTAYFTVTGKVLICDIIGEVTVEIGSGANNAKLIANPTVGDDVDLCAVLDIDGDVVGTLYNITGTLANAMVATTSGAFKSQADTIVITAGTIDLYCSASKAGQTKWCLYYLPLEAGATVTAT